MILLRSCDDGLICNQVYTRDRRGAPIPDRFVVKEAGVSVLLTNGTHVTSTVHRCPGGPLFVETVAGPSGPKRPGRQ